jgi:hypothetical protein
MDNGFLHKIQKKKKQLLANADTLNEMRIRINVCKNKTISDTATL